MSKLDDLANTAPVPLPVTSGPTPPYQGGSTPPSDLPPNRPNAFTEVAIKQLYFFMWKWLAASILFGLPFLVLNLPIVMLSH